jgi:hypothetical protein
MVEADVGEDAFRSITAKSTTSGHYTMGVLTPLLTPLSAQHAETVGNRQQGNQPIYADSATWGNA